MPDESDVWGEKRGTSGESVEEGNEHLVGKVFGTMAIKVSM